MVIVVLESWLLSPPWKAGKMLSMVNFPRATWRCRATHRPARWHLCMVTSCALFKLFFLERTHQKIKMKWLEMLSFWRHCLADTFILLCGLDTPLDWFLMNFGMARCYPFFHHTVGYPHHLNPTSLDTTSVQASLIDIRQCFITDRYNEDLFGATRQRFLIPFCFILFWFSWYTKGVSTFARRKLNLTRGVFFLRQRFFLHYTKPSDLYYLIFAWDTTTRSLFFCFWVYDLLSISSRFGAWLFTTFFSFGKEARLVVSRTSQTKKII